MLDESLPPDDDADTGQGAVERFKRLIGALDRDHQDWPNVYRTLKALPPYVRDWADSHPETDWLVSAIESMARISPKADAIDVGLYPKRGYFTERPIFAALAVQPHSGVSQELVRNLQTGLLVAAALRERQLVEGSYVSPPRSAGQSVRDLAEKGLSSRLSDDLCDTRSISELCEKVLDWLSVPEVWQPGSRQLELTDFDRKTLAGLRALLRDAKEKRPTRHRRVGNRRVKKTRVEAADRSAGSGPAVTGEELNDTTKREMRAEGLSPVPEGSSEATIADYPTSRNPDYPANRLTEAQANRRNLIRARAWKSSQQWIPNRTEILHPPALAALFAINPKWSRKSFVRWEMLLLMLFSGAEAKDIIHCQVWRTLADVPTHPEALGIIAETGMLVLPCPGIPDGWQPDKAFPNYFTKPDRKLNEYYRTVSSRLLLPLPLQLRAAERLVLRASQLSSDRLYPRLKADHEEDLVAALKAHLSVVNETHHTVVTLHRISKHVANAAYALDGDLAEALMLSYRYRQSNDHRLYYYAPGLDHLANQYGRIWQSSAFKPDVENIPNLDALEHRHVGSAAVPLTGRIRSTVSSMVEQVGAVLKGRGRRTRETWRATHNAMTAYVLRQIQWMTGIRAVRDPVAIPNYDHTTGFLRINDKDSNDQFGARVVWLLPQVQRQIGSYLAHVERASKALGIEYQQLVFRFVQDDDQCPEVSNQALARFTPCEYPYADNAHRHYMRTRLRDLGIDAGYVDAWHGHGGTGREPYARHSTMTPARLQQVMAPALESIWEELGWAILPTRQ